MVDINKELLDYKKEGIQFVRDELYREKDEIDKKLHVINVFSALCKIQDFLENDEFHKINSSYLSIKNIHDYDRGHVIEFDLLDINKTTVNQPSSTPNLFRALKTILDIIKMDVKFIGTALPSEQTAIFYIDKNLIDNLKNFLLSNELKASLNYSLLDIQLSQKPADSRKMKL